MSTTWFTSDHHFGHTNIIRYCHRPFATMEEMDAELVTRWNTRVAPDDTIYHLGDFTLGSTEQAAQIFSQLNGRIFFLPGSHDHWLRKMTNPMSSRSGHPVEVCPPLVSLKFPGLGQEQNSRHPQIIVLCHYAMRVWDRSHYGAWHLYGHSHGSLPGLGKSFDVGVDCTDFYPLSLEQVAERMAATS